MRGIRIKITNSSLDTYWYAGLIGNEYWATLEENLDHHMSYKIILDGIIPAGRHGTKFVNFDDCEVIRESDIRVYSVTDTKIIEYN